LRHVAFRREAECVECKDYVPRHSRERSSQCISLDTAVRARYMQ